MEEYHHALTQQATAREGQRRSLVGNSTGTSEFQEPPLDQKWGADPRASLVWDGGNRKLPASRRFSEHTGFTGRIRTAGGGSKRRLEDEW